MRFRIGTRGFDLTGPQLMDARGRADRLWQRLESLHADTVTLEIRLEKLPRREEFLGNARLILGYRVLPASRNRGSAVEPLIGCVFDNLHVELDRMEGRLRGNAHSGTPMFEI